MSNGGHADVVSAERGDGGESRHPRFPALDPEPPPSARYRRLARSVAVTIVALAVVLGLARLTFYLLGNHGQAPPASSTRSIPVRPASDAPAGTIVSLTSGQYLAVSDLRGDRPTELSSLGKMVPAPDPTLDNRYLVTPFAQLITFTAQGHPVVTQMKDVNAGYWDPVASEPLADHDQEAVLYSNGAGINSGNNPIEISSLATGVAYSPWQADNVAGDPQMAGIFASVAAPFQASSNPTNSYPDASVQLLDFNRPRVVLASAAELDADVRLAATTRALFFPYPSPNGDLVAIVVQPITQPGESFGQEGGGVVVLTRTGREVASFGAAGGLISPAWSLSGTSLAIAANSGHGTVLRIWETGGVSSSQSFPPSEGNQYGDCIWSPDGAWILCAESGAKGTAGQNWVVASVSGGPMVVTHGPGLPLAWLGEAH